MYTLILLFHMGHMPIGGAPLMGKDSAQIEAYSPAYDSKRACELAGAMVKGYFHAEASDQKPNGDGSIEYKCVKK